MSCPSGISAAEEIVALERAALERWGKGDPSGFLDLYAADVVYFDPFQERLHGIEAVTALYESIRGQVSFERFDMMEPLVQDLGGAAVLTFGFVSWSGDKEDRWKTTEVYVRTEGRWRIAHTHWSRPESLPG